MTLARHIVVDALCEKRVDATLVPKDLKKKGRIDVAKEILVNVADGTTFIKRIKTSKLPDSLANSTPKMGQGRKK